MNFGGAVKPVIALVLALLRRREALLLLVGLPVGARDGRKGDESGREPAGDGCHPMRHRQFGLKWMWPFASAV